MNYRAREDLHGHGIGVRGVEPLEFEDNLQIEKKALEERWRRIIRSWSLSGLTKAHFCRENELSIPSFHWWHREIKKRNAKKDHGHLQKNPSGGYLKPRPLGVDHYY